MRRRFGMPVALLLLLSPLSACEDVNPTQPAVSQLQMVIVPSVISITLDESVQLSVMVLDAQGNLLPHPAAAEMAWESSDPGIAKVTANGMVEALSEGEVNITAGCHGQCAWATVNVGR